MKTDILSKYVTGLHTAKIKQPGSSFGPLRQGASLDRGQSNQVPELTPSRSLDLVSVGGGVGRRVNVQHPSHRVQTPRPAISSILPSWSFQAGGGERESEARREPREAFP